MRVRSRIYYEVQGVKHLARRKSLLFRQRPRKIAFFCGLINNEASSSSFFEQMQSTKGSKVDNYLHQKHLLLLTCIQPWIAGCHKPTTLIFFAEKKIENNFPFSGKKKIIHSTSYRPQMVTSISICILQNLHIVNVLYTYHCLHRLVIQWVLV